MKAGLGNLAYGHTEKVHGETDLEKRGFITQFINKLNFPEWEPAYKKRKL